MEKPEVDGKINHPLVAAKRLRRNARAFLVSVARFAEVCEVREERRARNNPWVASQVEEN